MKKKLMDFTIEEAVRAATIGFGEIDPDARNSGWDAFRDALQMVVYFKSAQKQDEISTRLLGLTKWLVILTIAIVIFTLVLVWLTFKLVCPH